MVIREALIDDVPRIVAMGLRFIQETVYVDRIGQNPEQITRLVEALIQGATGGTASVVLLLERDGAVVGMLGVLVGNDHVSGELIATEMFWWVDPEARGGSGAIRLLNTGKRWAKAQGAIYFRESAPTDDVAAFYERQGDVLIERVYQCTL